jgi:cytochrome c oxidase cbb3-type subunit 2
MRSRGQEAPLLLAALALACLPPRPAEGAPAPLETETALALGRTAYRKACQACHGARGDGKGPVGRYLTPRPRDFTRARFKLRSTETGEPPTDEDLFRVITRGIPGTRMPAWPQLTEQERWSLVRFVRALADGGGAEGPPRLVDTRGRVPASPESVARGRVLYEELQCAKCHGTDGRGDGPAAKEQKDEDGFALTPNDLTRVSTYKGGAEAPDIYLRLMGGLDGTPMPSYAQSFPVPEGVADTQYRIEEGEEVSVEEREEYERAMAGIRESIWHLANYVESLAREETLVHELFLGDTEVTR